MELMRLSPPENERLTTTEAAVVVARRLFDGEALTTARVAELTGFTHSGAYRLMTRISRVASVYQEGIDWRLLDGEVDG